VDLIPTEKPEKPRISGGVLVGIALAALVAIVCLLAVILPAAVGR
jgi:hypothetical protein